MTCHRTILICRNLRGQNVDIQHIIDDQTIETQADLEKRLIAQLKLYPDNTDPNALIERAYDAQGDRIAYVEKGEREPNEILSYAVEEDLEAVPEEAEA